MDKLGDISVIKKCGDRNCGSYGYHLIGVSDKEGSHFCFKLGKKIDPETIDKDCPLKDVEIINNLCSSRGMSKINDILREKKTDYIIIVKKSNVGD